MNKKSKEEKTKGKEGRKEGKESENEVITNIEKKENKIRENKKDKNGNLKQRPTKE